MGRMRNARDAVARDAEARDGSVQTEEDCRNQVALDIFRIQTIRIRSSVLRKRRGISCWLPMEKNIDWRVSFTTE